MQFSVNTYAVVYSTSLPFSFLLLDVWLLLNQSFLVRLLITFQIYISSSCFTLNLAQAKQRDLTSNFLNLRSLNLYCILRRSIIIYFGRMHTDFEIAVDVFPN